MISGTRAEIDYLFRNAVFNLEQIEMIGDMCKVLGKYMFLDRSLLDARAGEKIGLSYIHKALKHNIITQMKYESKRGTKEIYFYQLGMGGIHLLEKANIKYHEMNILAGVEMKSRILTFNYFALENNYDISMRYKQDHEHRFFCCKDNIICYYSDVIKEMELIRILMTMFRNEDNTPTPDEIRQRFNFIPIDIDMYDIGKKTKAC